MKAYITKYVPERNKIWLTRTPSMKFELLKRAKDILDPLLEVGYEFTLMDIKELIISFHNEVSLYNNEIKEYLNNTYVPDHNL